MKKRIWLFFAVICLVGVLVSSLKQTAPTADYGATPQTLVDVMDQYPTKVPFSTKQVYWIEPLGDRHTVAFVKTAKAHLLLVLQQTDSTYRVIRLIRQAPQTTDWFEGQLLEVEQTRYLVVYGENRSQNLNRLTFDPYKATFDGKQERNLPLKDIKRTLDVRKKDSFHTIQPLPEAFPRSLFFDIHAVDEQGNEQLRRLSNTLD
ncbi:hypothetical protein QK289_12090 [Exiguobacterium antarcticum]|uniref:Uncharacterized protein n=1 Tax=Exiguobacterium antarcticum TaxID=132920 RepID=A0ABT6R4K6_9BACL|nr:hypothetical protein [Exiguobacterium antarcticum]MDI3235750.1 hypothetical protein [Exiguobacterium antarcticum]